MRTILIVEDDEDDILFLQRAHDRAELRCHLEFARDGDAAVDYLSDPRQPRPRFVLLDLRMPRRDGHEVLGWIRAQRASMFLPVIVFSSSADAADVERAYRAGASSYFVKSPRSEQLTDMLRVLVRHWIDYHVPPARIG